MDWLVHYSCIITEDIYRLHRYRFGLYATRPHAKCQHMNWIRLDSCSIIKLRKGSIWNKEKKKQRRRVKNTTVCTLYRHTLYSKSVSRSSYRFLLDMLRFVTFHRPWIVLQIYILWFILQCDLCAHVLNIRATILDKDILLTGPFAIASSSFSWNRRQISEWPHSPARCS